MGFSFKERGKTWITNLLIFVVEGNLYWECFYVKENEFEQKEFSGKNNFKKKKKKVSIALALKKNIFGSQKNPWFLKKSLFSFLKLFSSFLKDFCFLVVF